MQVMVPIVWTIAGSDSSGGAGIQADLKTINGLGAYGASVITAITAQNTLGVDKIEAVQPETVRAQIDALKRDLPPQAVKMGMLHSGKCIEVVASALEGQRASIVIDPVMIATSGDNLFEPDLLVQMRDCLLPLADIITPNLDEAHRLLDLSISQYRSMRGEIEQDNYVENLAAQLLKLGPKSVLIKRGDEEGKFSQDYWSDGQRKAWLTSIRQVTRNSHGTGCTLSAALAACLAQGYEMLDALVVAKAYVNMGMRLAPGIGRGNGPLAHLGWPENQDDLPWLTSTALDGRKEFAFPGCGHEPLGFYPIVDSCKWVERLTSLGVRTLQLRVKNLTGSALEEEIVKAIDLTRRSQCRLFINDFWQLAIKHNAYGVHLGQEDLQTADVESIAHSGLRLGVSTHSYAELARVLALRPSYIGFGPIYETTTKEVRSQIQGVDALKRWRRMLRYPLVAIGGITLQNAEEVLQAGVNGIAVIRDVVKAADADAQVRAWLHLFEGRKGTQALAQISI
jgi:hydroxymethylpyrimidine kinase/phosphomethylpyrimidine kinase/thiamine-phosphate diphosphorylase